MYVPIGGPAWLQGWSNDTVTVGIIGCIANVTLTSVDSRPIHLTVESAALRHHVTQCRPQVPPWPPKSSTTVSSILSTMRWTTTKNTPCALSFWKPLRSTFTMKNWFCNIIWGGGFYKEQTFVRMGHSACMVLWKLADKFGMSCVKHRSYRRF